MNSYRFILLVADPSLQRTPAFERACCLALAAQAPLHICLLVRNSTIALTGLVLRKGAAAARGAFVESCRHWLQGEAEVLRAKGLEVSFDAQWSSAPKQDLMAIIGRLQPDLVIKDAEPDAALQGLGKKVQEHLLRACPVPVLLVRGDSRHEPHNVAAAVDTDRSGSGASDFNELIFDTASAIAGYTHAELHLIHVNTQAAPGPGAGNLAAFAQAHHVPSEHCHQLDGTAVQGLVDLIERNGIDFLVVGRSPDTHRVLPWSAPTERINRSASCDVLTVRQAPHNPLQRDSSSRAAAAMDTRTPA